jgi:hypothetical protein
MSFLQKFFGAHRPPKKPKIDRGSPKFIAAYTEVTGAARKVLGDTALGTTPGAPASGLQIGGWAPLIGAIIAALPNHYRRPSKGEIGQLAALTLQMPISQGLVVITGALLGQPGDGVDYA